MYSCYARNMCNKEIAEQLDFSIAKIKPLGNYEAFCRICPRILLFSSIAGSKAQSDIGSVRPDHEKLYSV